MNRDMKKQDMEKNLAFAEMLGEMMIFAMTNKQTVGEKNDYYLTVQQIESFMKKYLYPVNE